MTAVNQHPDSAYTPRWDAIPRYRENTGPDQPGLAGGKPFSRQTAGKKAEDLLNRFERAFTQAPATQAETASLLRFSHDWDQLTYAVSQLAEDLLTAGDCPIGVTAAPDLPPQSKTAYHELLGLADQAEIKRVGRLTRILTSRELYQLALQIGSRPLLRLQNAVSLSDPAAAAERAALQTAILAYWNSLDKPDRGRADCFSALAQPGSGLRRLRVRHLFAYLREPVRPGEMPLLYDHEYTELLVCRQLYAQKLGFNDGLRLCLAEMELPRVTTEQLSGFLQELERWLIPLAAALRQRQNTLMAVPGAKNSDGPDFLNRPEAFIAWADQCFGPPWSDGKLWQTCLQEGYLTLNTSEPGIAGPVWVGEAAGTKLPRVVLDFSQPDNGTTKILDLCLAYGYLRASDRGQTGCSLGFSASYPESCFLRGFGAAVLLYGWSQNAADDKTARQLFDGWLSETIQALLQATLLTTFELACFSDANQTVLARQDLWLGLLSRFYPEKVNDSGWLQSEVNSWHGYCSVFAAPLAYLPPLLAAVSSLTLWDQCRVNQRASFAAYLRFVHALNRETWDEAIKTAKLPDPFDLSTIRRASFRLAYHFQL
ncbi:M3 family oligoendopeptidase [Oscillospiraceae bacterium HV4-5-C5C]|nr:M3 family oligoendopeptidase [Oscillospiraceae bacterium HV4-5-C5C]